MGRYNFSTEDNIKQFAWVLGAVAAIQSVLGILQYFTLIPWTSNFFVGYETQVFGTFKNPNLLGAFLALSLPLIFFLIYSSSKGKRILWLGVLMLILFALLGSKSRGAWVAALIGTAVYWWNSIPSVRNYFQKRSGSKLILIIAIFLTCLPFFYYLYHLNPASVNGRFFIWSVSRNMIRDDILTGVGFGNFGLHWLYYQGATFAQSNNFDYSLAISLQSAHSQYLQIFAESGIIGLILFFTLIGFVFKAFYKSQNPRITTGNQITTMLFCSIVILLIHGLVEDVFTSIPIQTIFLIMLSLFVSATVPEIIPRSPKIPKDRKWLRLFFAPVILLVLLQDAKIYQGEYLWKKGQDYAKGDNWSKAIQYYVQAKSHLPKSSELDFYLGAAYSKTGQPEKAIDCLLSSMNGLIDKNQYLVLGKAYIDDKQYDKAKKALDQVLHFYPGLLSPHFWLSRIYYEQGDTLEAKKELLTILRAGNTYHSEKIERLKADARRTLIMLNSNRENLKPTNHWQPGL
ncbi:MAG: O-antigen ligase family protein [Candidatus Marinimicrobia bacterium]|nr:O-antigen ligase family protein [Candidatus Neomarinimicrobiota bacterium]